MTISPYVFERLYLRPRANDEAAAMKGSVMHSTTGLTEGEVRMGTTPQPPQSKNQEQIHVLQGIVPFNTSSSPG